MRRCELEVYRGRPAEDLLGPHLKLLFVGINPGLWTAAVNAHFARPGNRFWPALYRAGITRRLVDASAGMPAQDRADLAAKGVGITNLVNVATARADELTAAELRAGGSRLVDLVASLEPRLVAVLGLTAFRTAFGRPKAVAGEQRGGLAGSRLWVAPNPSGLNAHETVESLTAAYRQIAEAAGVACQRPPTG